MYTVYLVFFVNNDLPAAHEADDVDLAGGGRAHEHPRP
jgi:hypothetical protein